MHNDNDDISWRVRERIKAEADQLALAIFRTYDLSWDIDKIVITVKKDVEL